MVDKLTPQQEEVKKSYEYLRKIIDTVYILIPLATKHECVVLDKTINKFGWYEGAICAICKKDYGWYCPNNDKHICDYQEENGKYSEYCKYCGEPDERK